MNKRELKKQIAELIQKNYLVGDSKVCAEKILALLESKIDRNGFKTTHTK